LTKTHGKTLHEVQRNLLLTDGKIHPPLRPQLFPSPENVSAIQAYADKTPYVVLAPASVWFTKQLPAEKWRELMRRFSPETTVYLVGGSGDTSLAETLMSAHPQALNLCGKLSFLESAALMRHAQRVYVNDSAPLHFASAVNAPVTAFFCSTVPAFGFGPLSDDAQALEVTGLDCRPCGLHGYKECPKGHFKCGIGMPVDRARL
jgi:ADP-heptose:LPS heptosyltransferase